MIQFVAQNKEVVAISICLLGVLLSLCFSGAVSVMFYFDGRFFRLANRIIKPEEE